MDLFDLVAADEPKISKTCLVCHRKPSSWGIEFKKPRHCSSHRIPGDVRTRRNWCQFSDTCFESAKYGLRGDMVTFCIQRHDEDIDVYHDSKDCQYPGCQDQRLDIFGSKFCDLHNGKPLPEPYLNMIRLKGRNFSFRIGAARRAILEGLPNPSTLITLESCSNENMIDMIDKRLSEDPVFVEEFKFLLMRHQF